MGYKTGSYIIRGRIIHRCLHCNDLIKSSFLHFARINEIGEALLNKKGEIYFHNEYFRYHLDCGLVLSDLKDFEKILIENNKPIEQSSPYKPSASLICSEKHLRKTFETLLKRYEFEKKLSYVKIPQGLIKYPNNKTYFTGKRGCSDLIVFLPKGKTIFIELKYGEKDLREHQIKFQSLVASLGYEYICIRDKIGISQFTNRLNA